MILSIIVANCHHWSCSCCLDQLRICWWNQGCRSRIPEGTALWRWPSQGNRSPWFLLVRPWRHHLQGWLGCRWERIPANWCSLASRINLLWTTEKQQQSMVCSMRFLFLCMYTFFGSPLWRHIGRFCAHVSHDMNVHLETFNSVHTLANRFQWSPLKYDGYKLKYNDFGLQINYVSKSIKKPSRTQPPWPNG